MSRGSRIIEAVGLEVGPRSQTEAADNVRQQTPEEALVLQTAWEERETEDVLELGSDLAIDELDVLELDHELVEENEFEAIEQIGAWPGWLVPSLAFISVVAWTGFFIASHWQSMQSGAAMAQWSEWISDWAVPVLLVAVACLLALRNSRSEARRFGNTAAMLSREATALETRLTTINRELSLARDFLGTQARELDSLGRIAADRLTTHAGALEGLIHDNGTRIDSIASVSDTALANMEKLRSDLPVIANSAKDVSNQVGNVGRNANEQMGTLIAGFKRLNEFGQASERQVESFDRHVSAAIERFDAELSALDELATSRFAALHEKSDAYRTEMDAQEAATLAAMQSRADDLRERLAGLREELGSSEDKSLEAVRLRIATLREEGETLSNQLREAETSAFDALVNTRDRFHATIKQTVEDLDRLDEQAVGAAQQRVIALKNEAGRFDDLLEERDRRFTDEMTSRQDSLTARETEAVERMVAQIAGLDDVLSRRASEQDERSERLNAQAADIAAKVGELSALYDSISEKADKAAISLDSSAENLANRAREGEQHFRDAGKTMEDLTDASMRLLEILQSSSAETRENLPAAIRHATELLTGVEDRAVMLSATMEEAGKRGDKLSESVGTANTRLGETDALLDRMGERVASEATSLNDRIESLRESIGALEEDSAQLTEKSAATISAGIENLDEAIRNTISRIENDSATQLEALAQSYGEKAAETIEQSISGRVEALIAQLEEKTQSASGSSQIAAAQLREQLAEVNDLTANLEQRITKAREQAEERNDADFARRMAQITESLNSNAIDIASALSTEVTDQAWAAYLKGDRGIFTRRAVRLLDAGQSKQVLTLYDDDEVFHNNVNRYIHDFEAMLRSMLATREGNALSVTMLGSDMGKLYVALAQSIERLRA